MIKSHILSIFLLLSLLLVIVNCDKEQQKQQDDNSNVAQDSQDFGSYPGSTDGDLKHNILEKIKGHLTKGWHGFKSLFTRKAKRREEGPSFVGGGDSEYGREEKYPYKPDYEKEANYNKKPESHYSTNFGSNNKKNVLPASGFNQGSQVGGIDENYKGESKTEFKQHKEPKEFKENKEDKEDKTFEFEGANKEDKVDKVDKVDKPSEFEGANKPFEFQESGKPSVDRKFGSRYAAYGKKQFGQNDDQNGSDSGVKKQNRYRRSAHQPNTSHGIKRRLLD